MFLLLEVSSGCGDESKEESIAAAPVTGKATSAERFQSLTAVLLCNQTVEVSYWWVQ